jgi:hypothetical protein
LATEATKPPYLGLPVLFCVSPEQRKNYDRYIPSSNLCDSLQRYIVNIFDDYFGCYRNNWFANLEETIKR